MFYLEKQKMTYLAIDMPVFILTDIYLFLVIMFYFSGIMWTKHLQVLEVMHVYPL